MYDFRILKLQNKGPPLYAQLMITLSGSLKFFLQCESEEESEFTLIRHKTPHPATLRENEQKAKKIVDALNKNPKTFSTMINEPVRQGKATF